MDVSSILELCKEGPVDRDRLNVMIRGYLDLIALKEDDAVQKNLLRNLVHRYVSLEKRVDLLLKNTLPEKVAEEIKYEGTFTPRQFHCTILFSDFVGFTQLTEKIPGEKLIIVLDGLFSGFDDIIAGLAGTKIKTIGDAYMAVFGAPEPYEGHEANAVNAGLGMQVFVKRFNEENGLSFGMRIGIHTGTVMAGVVGRERMQFDVFGDDVNIASRFESSGEKDMVNVSQETYSKTEGLFIFQERGPIALKHKDNMKAYFALKEKK